MAESYQKQILNLGINKKKPLFKKFLISLQFLPHAILYYVLLIVFSAFNRFFYIQKFNLKSNTKILNFLKKYNETLPDYNIGHKIRKIEEGFYFNKYEKEISDISNLEIGVESGLVSSVHLPNTYFKYGNEMLTNYIEEAMLLNRWEIIHSYDYIKGTQFKNDSIGDIVMIHVIDHIQNLEVFLKEIKRIQKSGSKLIFSGLSKNHIKKYELFGPNFTYRDKSYSESFNQYNFYNKEEWSEILNNFGYEIKEFELFNGTNKFNNLFYHFIYYGLYKYKAGVLINYLSKKTNFFKKLNIWIFNSIETPNLYNLFNDKTFEDYGKDFFCLARKI